jgi:CarD family transcriptional regulator
MSKKQQKTKKAAPKATEKKIVKKPAKAKAKKAVKTVAKKTPAPVKAATKKKPAPKMVAKPAAKAPVKAAAKADVTPKTIPNKSIAKAAIHKAPVAVKPASAQSDTKNAKPGNDNVDFSSGDYVVYPAHGVGQIEGVETQTIAGMEIRLYAVSFEKERMRLKIPVMKAQASGLRRLSTTDRLKDAIKTLKGRARVRRTMWSRRAQEYEMKINSGDPLAIAEVLRDLKRSNEDSEQSYSERQIYQSALERLAREVAAVERITEIVATERLEGILGKSAAEKPKDAAKEPAKDAKKAA